MNARVDAPIGDAAPGLRRVEVLRHEAGEHRRDHEWVIDEAPVALVYNGVSHVVMMATPTALEHFAVGFSLSEGLLDGIDDLRDLRLEQAEAGVSVHLEVSPRAFDRFKDRRRQLAGRTGCGLCGIDSLQAFQDTLPERTLVAPPAGAMDLSTAVRRALQALPRSQALQARSGGCHAAAWASADGHIACVREDVGRHNALDKLIGALALAGQLPTATDATSTEPPSGLIVVSSRASHEMVSKCVRAGVGTLGAISAPTSLAISLAQRSGLRLFGFCRGEAAVAYA